MRRTGVIALLMLMVASAAAQIGGYAGAFSRMGFGARGIGMGNAQTAVVTGAVVGHYNPAALPLADTRTLSLSHGILSLDRALNFLSFNQPLKPKAGLAAGIINAGVGKIDGRDSDGRQTGDLSTSENMVYLSFANRFSEHLSLGITTKLYHHRLYEDVSTTIVAFDFGVLVPVNEDLTIGATVRDINATYKWDTGQLYGSLRGRRTDDKFPVLYTVGVAYRLPGNLGLVALDVESSNQKTLTTRFGVEVPLIPEVTVRGGLDRIDLKEKGSGVRPAFGFSASQSIGDWTPAVNYAYVIEPFSSTGMHIISLSVVF
jgi:long-subunit fatty acid transport protein